MQQLALPLQLTLQQRNKFFKPQTPPCLLPPICLNRAPQLVALAHLVAGFVERRPLLVKTALKLFGTLKKVGGWEGGR